MELKHCFNCKQMKPRSDFTTDPGTKDGLLWRCRSCERELLAEYRKTPKYKAYQLEYSRKRYARHKQKYQARAKVNYAVKNGSMIKPNQCDRCKESKGIQAHHEDYDKPLEVKWLCDLCHRLTHGRLKDVKLIAREGNMKSPAPNKPNEAEVK